MAAPYYNCPEASLHGAETGKMSVEQQHTQAQRCPMWDTANINKQVQLGGCEKGAAAGSQDNRDWGTRSCWHLFLTLDLR